MKWRKRQKKPQEMTFFPYVYFFLLVTITPMVCHTVSALED